MTIPCYDVVIVGGGHGGAQTAITLRQAKFAGTIAIVGEEVELPYERPPLSKEYLAGEKPFDRLLIRPATFWAERNVHLLGGRRITSVDPRAQRIEDAEGGQIAFGTLVWAAGGHARRLTCAGHDLEGVHAVRSRADVDRMIAELPAIERVCIVGGGYIGLEAAAVLTKLGRSVTLLEAQDRVLARVAGATLSRFYEEEHRARGVDVRLGAMVDCIVGRDGRATGVRLSNGREIGCDMVIVGVGIVPSIDPLRAAGADCGNGVVVDTFCRTSLEGIYAIGDCALHRNAYAGGDAIRLESVQNANDMAAVVARSITGGGGRYHVAPWFWSNQYDLRLQTVGLSTGFDTEVLRGDPASRSFSVAYLRDGVVIAVDCVNATRDYVQGKSLLMRRCDPVRLANAAIPLKEVEAGLAGGVPLR